MSKRNSTKVRISRDLDAYLDNLSKELTRKAKWRKPVSKTESSRYLAQLLNKKSTLRLKKKGRNILDMDLLWEE